MWYSAKYRAQERQRGREKRWEDNIIWEQTDLSCLLPSCRVQLMTEIDGEWLSVISGASTTNPTQGYRIDDKDKAGVNAFQCMIWI